MKLKKFTTVFFMLILSIALFANDTTAVSSSSSSGGGIDWFQIIISAAYLIGVFILLPIVVYTNNKSKLYSPKEGESEDFQTLRDLDESKRNERAREILEAIEDKLTAFTDDDGQEMITITKGKQAKFMKNGLDYINKNLKPTDPEIIERVNEFAEIYKIRTKRIFTGSKWIIAASVGVGLLMLFTGGISTFIFIHALGIAFYILSSRTPMYALEKRRFKFSQLGTGMIGGIMTALALGDGTKYYVSTNGGPYQRDWETEGSMALMGLVFLIVIALFLGFAAAFLGVINFIFNYSQSFILPFNKTVDWYEEKFKMQNV
jgi:hypothetical protein